MKWLELNWPPSLSRVRGRDTVGVLLPRATQQRGLNVWASLTTTQRPFMTADYYWPV